MLASSLLSLGFVVLLVLKLAGVILWSWWIVFMPLGLMACLWAFWFAVLVMVGVVTKTAVRNRR